MFILPFLFSIDSIQVSDIDFMTLLTKTAFVEKKNNLTIHLTSFSLEQLLVLVKRVFFPTSSLPFAMYDICTLLQLEWGLEFWIRMFQNHVLVYLAVLVYSRAIHDANTITAASFVLWGAIRFYMEYKYLIKVCVFFGL